MSNKVPAKKHRLPRLSFHPLKAEEALSLFMQVDPAKVKTRMKKMRQKRGKVAAWLSG